MCAQACAGPLCQYLNTKDTLPPHTCSAIMDVKVGFVIVCLCTLAITSSEGKDTQAKYIWQNQGDIWTEYALIYTSGASKISK